VPTDPEQVKLRLRELGHPICLFGEDVSAVFVAAAGAHDRSRLGSEAACALRQRARSEARVSHGVRALRVLCGLACWRAAAGGDASRPSQAGAGNR
jgi:hypothetical protein